MNEEYINEYKKKIALIMMDKISKLKGVNPELIDHTVVDPIIDKAALNFLALRYNMFDSEEFQLLDNFDIDTINVDENWTIGGLQAVTDIVGMSVNISRYGADDLSDLSIQLTGDTDLGERIGIVEDREGTSGSIRTKDGKMVRWTDKELGYKEGNTTLKYDEMPARDLHSIIQLHREGKFSRDLHHPGFSIASAVSALIPQIVERDIGEANNQEIDDLTKDEGKTNG